MKWINVSETVYNVNTGEVELLINLKIHNINYYNDIMENVDLADQFCGTYQLDHWVHNQK